MWPNPQETADLVTLTEEILNGKLHFLCSDWYWKWNLMTIPHLSLAFLAGILLLWDFDECFKTTSLTFCNAVYFLPAWFIDVWKYFYCLVCSLYSHPVEGNWLKQKFEKLMDFGKLVVTKLSIFLLIFSLLFRSSPAHGFC